MGEGVGRHRRELGGFPGFDDDLANPEVKAILARLADRARGLPDPA
jgi:hypothetical protein